MKRLMILVLAAAILGLSGLLPFERTDVASLVPVDVLTVDLQRGQAVLKGGEAEGRGKTWEAALEDFRQGANGRVFFDTAGQVILSKDAVRLLPDVIRGEELRPAANICICTGPMPEPKEAAEYLSAHDGGVTIQMVWAAMLKGEGVALPILKETEGGLRLYGSENR